MVDMLPTHLLVTSPNVFMMILVLLKLRGPAKLEAEFQADQVLDTSTRLLLEI